MKKSQFNKNDVEWVLNEIRDEYAYLPDKEKVFFDKYKLNIPKLFELKNKTSYDDSMLVVLRYGNNIILMDDIEELFSVGTLTDNLLSFSGNFTSLNDAINYLLKFSKKTNNEIFISKDLTKNNTLNSPIKGEGIPDDFFTKEE